MAATLTTLKTSKRQEGERENLRARLLFSAGWASRGEMSFWTSVASAQELNLLLMLCTLSSENIFENKAERRSLMRAKANALRYVQGC